MHVIDKFRLSLHRSLALSFALTALASTLQAAEWKEKVLYSFQDGSDGATPVGGLVVDKQGNIFGATINGGSQACVSITECGTVFELSPPAKSGDPWIEQVLYVFKGNAAGDGAGPYGGIVIGKHGHIYGTTSYGGNGDCVLLGTKEGCGVVYELNPPQVSGGAWTERVIYNFQGGKDGQLPVGDLTMDKDGDLYGATEFGGGLGSCDAPFYQHCGTVYKLTRPKPPGVEWTEQLLHSFAGGKDGAAPNGGLLLDDKGAIYGTTASGGGSSYYLCSTNGFNGCGTAFKLQRERSGAWTEQVLRRFKGFGGAAGPSAMIFGPNNVLYISSGGGKLENGLIFSLRETTGGVWVEEYLYEFLSYFTSGPSGLVLDHNGDLYGAAQGGKNARGTMFRLVTDQNTESKWWYEDLYDFGGAPDGAYPGPRLTFLNEKTYSTTQGGGAGKACQNGCGAVFESQP
jgi:hypothetical protein